MKAEGGWIERFLKPNEGEVGVPQNAKEKRKIDEKVKCQRGKSSRLEDRPAEVCKMD